MKKLLFISILAAFLLMGSSIAIHAQMREKNPAPPNDHTVEEEAEGREVWKKLQAKTITCQNLSEKDFEHLGEYFMGAMMGDVHPAMNEMITRMHGEEGENQIHVAMGKRLSGCDPNALIPVQGQGWMPMMQMMWGGWPDERASRDGSSPFTNQFNNHMMYGFNNGLSGGLSVLGGIFMILWWVLIIAAVAALVKWIMRTGGTGSPHGKSALDTLKERYARGEIDKKEFEDKKKDLMA